MHHGLDHLEDGGEVLVTVFPSPLVEALPTLDDDEGREGVAVRCLAVASGVLLDGKGGGHDGPQLRLRVQLPLTEEGVTVQVELDRGLHHTGS